MKKPSSTLAFISLFGVLNAQIQFAGGDWASVSAAA
jgi:hypothetical protein